MTFIIRLDVEQPVDDSIEDENEPAALIHGGPILSSCHLLNKTEGGR